MSGGDHKGVRFITEKNTINISANNPEKARGGRDRVGVLAGRAILSEKTGEKLRRFRGVASLQILLSRRVRAAGHVDGG